MNNETNNEWQQQNPQLIKLFNEHLNIAASLLVKNGNLCPIIAFLNVDDEVETYAKNIRNPKYFPKLSEMQNIVKGAKESGNINAAAIIYCSVYNGEKVIQFDLDHKCGDCISILVPYSFKGFFTKKLQIVNSNNFIVQSCNSFVGW